MFQFFLHYKLSYLSVADATLLHHFILDVVAHYKHRWCSMRCRCWCWWILMLQFLMQDFFPGECSQLFFFSNFRGGAQPRFLVASVVKIKEVWSRRMHGPPLPMPAYDAVGFPRWRCTFWGYKKEYMASIWPLSVQDFQLWTCKSVKI